MCTLAALCFHVFPSLARFFFRKWYIIGILCSHSLGVGNRVSKSDRPFGGKKEEERALPFSHVRFFTKNSVCSEISWGEDVRYIYIYIYIKELNVKA